MAVKTRQRTEISLSKPIRDRITAGAQRNDQTIEAFLTGVLDEHERRTFWVAVDAVAGKYDQPIQDDYTHENAIIDDVENRSQQN